jgi:hypothetical protein
MILLNHFKKSYKLMLGTEGVKYLEGKSRELPLLEPY